jgi:hypothetical protein
MLLKQPRKWTVLIGAADEPDWFDQAELDAAPRARGVSVSAGDAVRCHHLAGSLAGLAVSSGAESQISRLNEIPCPDIYRVIYSDDRQRVAFVEWEKPVGRATSALPYAFRA